MAITLNLSFFYGILALLAIQLISNIYLMFDKYRAEKKLTAEQLKYFQELRRSIEDD